MPPAIRPAASWSEASVGPSVVTTGTLNFSGSAPYFRLLARFCASVWVKLPLISAWPLGMTPFTVGAEITLPSSTIASCFCCPVSWLVTLAIVRVTVAKVLRATLSKVRFTTHWTCCAGMPAVALFSWVPSMSAADRRYLLPLSSQVTSGRDLMSATGGVTWPFGGQLKFENFLSHTAPGSSIHFSGWSTGAPLAVTCGPFGGAALAAPVGSAEALADGFGDVAAGAEGLGDGLAPGLSARISPEDRALPFGVALGLALVDALGVTLVLFFGAAGPEALDDALGEAEPLGAAEPLGDADGDGWGRPGATSATSRNRSCAVCLTVLTRS